MVADAFFSWSNLATFSGAVAAVVFIVQFLKLPLDKVKWLPTRAVVYAVSFVILLAAQYFTEQAFTLELLARSALNSVLVALSAMALYEQAVAEPEAKRITDVATGIPVEFIDLTSKQEPPEQG